MKKLMLSLMLVFGVLMANSQVVDSTQTNDQPKYQKQAAPVKQEKKKSQTMSHRIFFGGSIGASFGSYTSVSLYPMIGYKLTPKLSVGVKFLYEYASYNYYDYGKQHYNNYGGSLFARLHFIPQAYLHAEYRYMSYEFSRLNNEHYRQGVPFLFLGAGFAQPISAHSFFYAQILFDVLNDTNSPYADWTPFYSVGVSVGL